MEQSTKAALIQHCDGESGRPTVSMTREQAEACSHSGACDADVAFHLDRVKWHATDAELRKMLKGYGAWDDLADADQKTLRSRMLWLAAGDIRENPEHYA